MLLFSLPVNYSYKSGFQVREKNRKKIQSVIFDGSYEILQGFRIIGINAAPRRYFLSHKRCINVHLVLA